MAEAEKFAEKFNDTCLKIAGEPANYHPVATNHFTVTIRLPQGLVNYADEQQRQFPEDTILTLKIANKDFKEPSFSQQKLSYKKGNLEINFPGAINAFSGSASFDVFVTKSAYDILYSWKMASGNHLTGEIGDPRDYWAEVEIDVTTGNKGTLIGTWTLHNVWLSQLDGTNFSNSSNDSKSVSVTMEYFKPTWQAKNPDVVKKS